jgi:hypothetical protein
MVELAPSTQDTCWLCSSSWQGISGLVAIAALVIQSGLTVWTTLKTTQGQGAGNRGHAPTPTVPSTRSNDQQPGLAARLSGAAFVWTISYLLYSLMWGALILAFGMSNLVPAFMIQPLFFLIAAPPATGALLARSPYAGAAFFGGASLGLIFLTAIPAADSGQEAAAPIIAYFVFGALFGALSGVVIAGLAFKLAQSLKLPLPRTAPGQND